MCSHGAVAAVPEYGLMVDDEVCTGDTFSIYWQNVTKGSGGLPHVAVVIAWGGFTLPDYNLDVRKSMGWTVGYPTGHPIAYYI